jgi:hypothetical protein
VSTILPDYAGLPVLVSVRRQSTQGTRSADDDQLKKIALDLYFQNESPGKDKEANWLPAPKGPFNLTMRIYAPKLDALTGKWNPPPVTHAESLPGPVGQ